MPRKGNSGRRNTVFWRDCEHGWIVANGSPTWSTDVLALAYYVSYYVLKKKKQKEKKDEPVEEYAAIAIPLSLQYAKRSFCARYGWSLDQSGPVSSVSHCIRKTHSTWFTAGITLAVIKTGSSLATEMSVNVRGTRREGTYVLIEKLETPIFFGHTGKIPCELSVETTYLHLSGREEALHLGPCLRETGRIDC